MKVRIFTLMSFWWGTLKETYRSYIEVLIEALLYVYSAFCKALSQQKCK